MTNADMLGDLTDDEFADLFGLRDLDDTLSCSACPCCKLCSLDSRGPRDNCVAVFRKWLDQDIEEDK